MNLKDSCEVPENFKLSSVNLARIASALKFSIPKSIVIHGSGLIVALLNAEEGFPYTQDMCRCRLLPKRHSKELLIELGRAVKVRNLHGDMVHTDSPEARRRRWSCERARGCQRASGQG
jgi:hypothetical protein